MPNAGGSTSDPEPAPIALLPADLDGFRAAILAWFDVERRDLPFRGTRDPYLVLVSEAMAQQTQISRVGPAWERFVARFPTIEALAAAPLHDVLRAWAGLGYNRRAVNLHRAARIVVAGHGARVPDDPAVLETLPGVGPYTARAIAAIAFGRRVGAVDTNVRRVIVRVTGLARPENAAGRTPGPHSVQRLADAVVPADRPADWTAALMDLGARHCRPVPICDGCPAAPWCATLAADDLPRGRRRRESPSARAVPFPSTARWLRGRLVAALRDAPGSGWRRFDPPIGPHEETAVTDALAALARDGIVEVDAADPVRARLARGVTRPLAR
jgi:A/G-specific adenine glycosylase